MPTKPITGQKSDAAHARKKRLGRPTRIDLSPWYAQLGKVPDSVIAEESGASRSRVQAIRSMRAKAAFRKERRYTPKEDEQILSDTPPREIAAKLDVTPRAVTLRRRWLKNR